MARTTDAALNSLTNLADVHKVLHDTLLRERLLSSKLEALYLEKEDSENDRRSLYSAAQELLDDFQAEADVLTATVRETTDLSERVSRKVRDLDLAQTNTKLTVAQTNSLLSRSKAVEGVQSALAAGKLEDAAGYIEQFLNLQRQLGDTADSPETEEEKKLQEAKLHLLSVFGKELSTARRDARHDKVFHYVKLHASLGATDEAIKAYIAYLRELARKRADEDYAALIETNEGEADFVGTLSGILSFIGSAIHENEEFVMSTFGPNGFVEVLNGLHAECNVSGVKLLQRYIQHRHLAQAMQDIHGHRASRHVGPQHSFAADPRQLEKVLEEMVLLTQRAESYTKYVLDWIAQLLSSSKQEAAVQSTTIQSSAFNTHVREITSYYIQMEEYYIEQSVAKGIELDEWSEDALVTSMVDDVFFILHKCSQRGLAMGNLQCSSAVLGQVNTVLFTNLHSALESRWKVATSALAQSLALALDVEAPVPSSEDQRSAALLNNADMSASYTTQLQGRLSHAADEVFSAPHDRERIQSVLADLGRTAAGFSKTARSSVDSLCGGLMLLLRSPLEEADACSYDLSEAEFSAREGGCSWVLRTLNLLAAVLQWLQPILTPGNYDMLVSLLLDKVVNRLEACMHLKQFNQLGGLQMDRNIRRMISVLSDITQHTIRERFCKLSQMATLLSLESLSELAEVGADASDVNWRFTDSQMSAVLSQRIEFDRDSIAQAFRQDTT